MIKFKGTVPQHVREGWHKQLGPMPSEEQLAIANGFSTRFGLEAFAGIACRLRKEGVTTQQQRQISALWSRGVSNGAHHNKARSLIAEGYFTDEGTRGVYKMALTEKGKAKLQGSAAGNPAYKAPPRQLEKGPRPGWIYIAATVRRPGEFKIGRTIVSPQQRIKQLSIPGREMKLLYWVEVTDAERVERTVHADLAHVRVPQSEFFAVTLKKAKQAIVHAIAASKV
jgi:hypothetical protein